MDIITRRWDYHSSFEINVIHAAGIDFLNAQAYKKQFLELFNGDIYSNFILLIILAIYPCIIVIITHEIININIHKIYIFVI